MDNLKLGKDLGISPLKFSNKYSTKELEELIKKLQDILYFFSTLYITQKAKDYLLEKLIEIGKATNDIVWPIEKGKRKEELRKKLTELYYSIKNYCPTNDYSKTCVFEWKMNQYLTSRFINEKKVAGMTDDFAIKWIKLIKQFFRIYGVNKCLKSCYDECLKHLNVWITLDEYCTQYSYE